MTDYRFREAGHEGLEACTELANLAFGIDFPTLLPKVYGENPIMGAKHYVADNGGLKGLVAVLKDRLTVDETLLKTGYVGTVCVHPAARGQGIMKKLMHLANSGMAADGTDIAFLNGNRQRYQYYGFVPAGVAYFFHITGDNLAHALREISAENICFEKIDSGSELESRARELYCSRPVHFERKEFASLCHSYYQQPYAVLNREKFIGYVVTNREKGRWAEVCVENTEALDLTIKAWMTQNKIRKLEMSLPEWEEELRRHLAGYASGMSRGSSVQARIFRFQRVVEAYLKVKAHINGIADGYMAFDIEGEKFQVTVEKGTVLVSPGGENPLKLTAYEANRLLLLPFPFEGMPDVPRDWFPLGIFVAPDAPDAF